MVLLKVYKCSVSKEFEYKVIDSFFDCYIVEAMHNNRIAIRDEAGHILWIGDNGYNLKIDDIIKFDKYAINVYDDNGDVIESKLHNYKNRVKDMKLIELKEIAIKAVINYSKDLKDLIYNAEINFMD